MKKIHKTSQVSSFLHISTLNMNAVKLVLILALSSIVVGCQSSTTGNNTPEEPLKIKTANEISVMSFNIENAFDTTHDEGTEDYTYLPLSQKNDPKVIEYCKSISNPTYRNECYNLDWNENVFKFKISQIAQVIRFVDNGQGPDAILFAEVENQNVLNRLFLTELKDLDYKTIVVLEGFDTRGIDVGFASKFPIAKNTKPYLHRIPYSDPKASKSRGILEVTVELPNRKNLTFLAAHFPSQANPTQWRGEAYDFASGLMKKYEAEGRAVIFGGDLNTLKEEDEESGYFSKVLSSAGSVSHLIGCEKCNGSHFYRGEWSFLDVLAFGKGLINADLELEVNSLSIIKASNHIKKDGTPLRFNSQKLEGVSDHLPLYSRLKILSRPN
jgi:hypothetical protein